MHKVNFILIEIFCELCRYLYTNVFFINLGISLFHMYEKTENEGYVDTFI